MIVYDNANPTGVSVGKRKAKPKGSWKATLAYHKTMRDKHKGPRPKNSLWWA